jgi:hypothetical protein
MATICKEQKATSILEQGRSRLLELFTALKLTPHHASEDPCDDLKWHATGLVVKCELLIQAASISELLPSLYKAMERVRATEYYFERDPCGLPEDGEELEPGAFPEREDCFLVILYGL